MLPVMPYEETYDNSLAVNDYFKLGHRIDLIIRSYKCSSLSIINKLPVERAPGICENILSHSLSPRIVILCLNHI